VAAKLRRAIRGRQETLMKRMTLATLAAATLAACGPSGAKKAEAPAQAPTAAPDTQGPLPALPAWASGYMGKTLSEVLPIAADCVGNTDKVRHRYAGPPAGATIVGWGWDRVAGKRIEHVLLTDETLKIVGAGDGGEPRLDVPRNAPDIQDDHTGWLGMTSRSGGLAMAFGVVSNGRAVCPLGQIQL
jgi:hypothetical protein